MVMKWNSVNILKIADVRDGTHDTPKQVAIGYPLVTSKCLKGGVIDFSDTYNVSQADFNQINQRSKVDVGDILFAMIGTIGNPVLIEQEPNFAIKNVALFKPYDRTTGLYLRYYLESELFMKTLEEIQSGSNQGFISLSAFRNMDIPFPPLPEQRAIATALSDVDSYISALEKMIAKKRAVKQGAVQNLLTNNRRLAGFERVWEEKPLKYYVSDFIVPMRDKPKDLDGNIPWCRIEDFDGKYLFKSKTNQGVSLNTVNEMNLKIYPVNTLIVSCSAYLGRCAIIKRELVTNQTFIGLVPNGKVDVEYLFYVMCREEQRLNALSSGTTISYLSREQFESYTIYMPPTKEEQTAIAEILSDMDAEIDALTAKLEKARHIKQGMMRELLTGRIRLVEQEAPAEAVAVPKIVELPRHEAKGHNQQFDDAVMIAGIVNVLYSDKYPLGRKKVQKCLYLLRRHQDESTEAFKKKAAGPYADEVRYKGGEPISRSANYIVTTSTKDEGTIFARGNNISQALRYIESWGKQGDIQWVTDKFKFKKVEELELLATVDMAICDLEEGETAVSVASIKHLIATNEEWKAKLKKQTFSDANIARAIRDLQTLL